MVGRFILLEICFIRRDEPAQKDDDDDSVTLTQMVQAWSFLSATLRATQVLSMDALSLHHTR